MVSLTTMNRLYELNHLKEIYDVQSQADFSFLSSI